MYLKLTYFLYHNLILFSEKNYKKQAQMLLRYFAIQFSEIIGLGLEKSRINFMIYCSWTRKILELPYWTWIYFMIYWS